MTLDEAEAILGPDAYAAAAAAAEQAPPLTEQQRVLLASVFRRYLVDPTAATHAATSNVA